MVSQIKVNEIIKQSGSSITIGESGDTINIPSGCTIANSGTATGFGEDNTPYFYGQLSANQTVTNGGNVIAALDEIEADSASGWSGASDYKWTCPSGQGGKYYIGWNFYMGSDTTNSTNWCYAGIKINGSETDNTVGLLTNTGTSNPSHRLVASNSIIQTLSAGDYVQLNGVCYVAAGNARFLSSSGLVIFKVSST